MVCTGQKSKISMEICMEKIILDRQMYLYRAEARDLLRGNWTRVYVGMALAAAEEERARLSDVLHLQIGRAHV